MKLRSLLTIVLVAALTLGVVWYLKPAASEPVKTAAAPKPAPKPAAPKAAPAQIAAPVVAPAAKPAGTAPAADPGAGEPQKELNTALTDISDLLSAGDLYTAMMRYLPPDMLDKMLAQVPESERANMQQMMQQQMSRPEAQQGIQMMIQVVDSMKTMTPDISAAGDKATYQISDPSGQDSKIVPFSFEKVDGKWYVSPDMMKGGF